MFLRYYMGSNMISKLKSSTTYTLTYLFTMVITCHCITICKKLLSYSRYFGNAFTGPLLKKTFWFVKLNIVYTKSTVLALKFLERSFLDWHKLNQKQPRKCIFKIFKIHICLVLYHTNFIMLLLMKNYFFNRLFTS